MQFAGSRYIIEQHKLRRNQDISEKKDLYTRGSRLFGIWIGIQHQQEYNPVSVLPSNVSSSRTQIAGVLPIPSRRARKEACHRSKADTISKVSFLTPTSHCQISSEIQSGVYIENPHSYCNNSRRTSVICMKEYCIYIFFLSLDRW